jgi:NodT family efflux transporter outer membrane factor (OMF) lipoprotein
MKPCLDSWGANRLPNTVAIATACSVLLALPGCFIPKLRPPKPGPALPQTFNGLASPDNSSWIGAPAFFNDPRLTSLIGQALVRNQQLRILAEDIQIANNEILRRRGAYLPFLSFGARASLDKLSTFTPPGADLSQIVSPAGRPFPNPLPDFLTAADITWQIDIWRQLRNARDAAGLRYLGTIDGWNYVVTRLVAEIAENYYRLMALDNQLETLDRTIALQEQSLRVAEAQKLGARGTELGVQRFLAEVRKNQSQILIIRQEIIETENRINFLCGRYPQPVERASAQFLNLQLPPLSVGVPPQLLQNRPDIRQAERELQAAGLDVRVARANFFPKLFINAGVGYEAYNTKYLFITPESLIYNVAGQVVAPLINRSAIKADYFNANARQLQALYEYQRTILNAFTEVINRLNRVRNYTNSVEIKRQQLASLETAVDVAAKLFQNARVEYIDVLLAQRDRNDARIVLIDTKNQQLAAVVNLYQALGGGWRPPGMPIPPSPPLRPQGQAGQMPTGQPPRPPVAEEVPPPPAAK